MTQQLDLTFNTTNTMDKMMTQSQTKSYSSSSFADADKFDNFLNTANKSYTRESNKSFNENKTQAKIDSHKDNKSNNVIENKTEYKEATKHEESSSTVTEEKSKTTQTDEKSKEAKDNTKMDIVEDVSEVVVPGEVVDNKNVALKDMMLVSNAQMANLEITKEDVSIQEETFAISDSVVDEEIPAEAIKSGINLETLAKAVETTVEDATGVDMQTVENAVKDTVSKEDTIAALYKVGTERIEEAKDVNVDTDKLTKSNEKDEIKVKDVKLEDVKVVDEKTENLQVEDVKNDTKAVDDNVVVADKFSDESKDIKSELNLKTKSDIKENLEVKNDAIDSNEKSFDVDVKTNKIVENNNISINLQDVKENVKNEVNTINVNEIVDNKSQKVETKVEVQTTSDKIAELNEEVQSSKVENAYETLSSQDNKSAKNENKLDDKFTKTNIQAEETMEIKDDTKGIEFVSQKQDKVVDKNDVQDKHSANAKEKVENIKIQVEDNVKVSVNNQVQDSAKVEKANETMDKAGLTTKTLRELDGKVTAMETGNQAGAQFGETSQEMLMRDMLSQNASTQTTDAKTTVDFAQALNKTTTQQPQAQQNTQEAQEVNILDQIRAKFAVSKQNGLQKITIGLTPESLGKVTVEIVKGQNGISAHLLADNPQAKEILDKNLDGLKSVLQSQGVNVNNVNVRVAEAGRSSDNSNNMFQNEDGQFNQGSNGEHSRGGSSSNQERHSEYEFMQNDAMQVDNSEVEETTTTVQMEKTVSIKGGNGKISYKL